MHFLHVRSKAPNAIPLILSHGWPGSVLECTKVIPLLTGTWFSTPRHNLKLLADLDCYPLVLTELFVVCR